MDDGSSKSKRDANLDARNVQSRTMVLVNQNGTRISTMVVANPMAPTRRTNAHLMQGATTPFGSLKDLTTSQTCHELPQFLDAVLRNPVPLKALLNPKELMSTSQLGLKITLLFLSPCLTDLFATSDGFKI